MKIKGKIKDIKLKEIMTRKGTKDMFFITINNETISGWGKCPYEKNQEVELEYEIKGEYKNLIQKREETEEKPEETTEERPVTETYSKVILGRIRIIEKKIDEMKARFDSIGQEIHKISGDIDYLTGKREGKEKRYLTKEEQKKLE